MCLLICLGDEHSFGCAIERICDMGERRIVGLSLPLPDLFVSGHRAGQTGKRSGADEVSPELGGVNGVACVLKRRMRSLFGLHLHPQVFKLVMLAFEAQEILRQAFHQNLKRFVKQ